MTLIAASRNVILLTSRLIGTKPQINDPPKAAIDPVGELHLSNLVHTAKATATQSDASGTIWSASLVGLAWPGRAGDRVDTAGDFDHRAKVRDGPAGNEGPAPFSVLGTPVLLQVRVGVGKS